MQEIHGECLLVVAVAGEDQIDFAEGFVVQTAAVVVEEAVLQAQRSAVEVVGVAVED